MRHVETCNGIGIECTTSPNSTTELFAVGQSQNRQIGPFSICCDGTPSNGPYQFIIVVVSRRRDGCGLQQRVGRWCLGGCRRYGQTKAVGAFVPQIRVLHILALSLLLLLLLLLLRLFVRVSVVLLVVTNNNNNNNSNNNLQGIAIDHLVVPILVPLILMVFEWLHGQSVNYC